MNDLFDLKQCLLDAADLLGRASRLAEEISGESAGREPMDVTIDEPCLSCGGSGQRVDWDDDDIPPCRSQSCRDCGGKGTWPNRYADPGEPAVEGWPAMSALADRLAELEQAVKEAMGGEVGEAMAAAEREADEAPDQVDVWGY